MHQAEKNIDIVKDRFSMGKKNYVSSQLSVVEFFFSQDVHEKKKKIIRMDFAIGIQNAFEQFDKRSVAQRQVMRSENARLLHEENTEGAFDQQVIQQIPPPRNQTVSEQEQLRKTIASWSLELLASKF